MANCIARWKDVQRLDVLNPDLDGALAGATDIFKAGAARVLDVGRRVAIASFKKQFAWKEVERLFGCQISS